MKHKAYSYLRFSTPEQMRGDSFRRQSELAQLYASKNKLDLDDKLTFRDLGVSAYQGKNVETGQLGAFLDAVKAGLVARGSYLLVESLDRISRQAARKALRALEALCDEGVVVVTLTDGREYTKETLDSDPMSLIMSLLIFIRANEESATKARRIRAAWDGKRQQIEDKPLTAQVPGWLWLDKASGKIKVHQDRAAVVRRVFKLSLSGVGQHTIAETLNREHVPVFGRGKHWHRSYIAKLLASQAVVGTLVPHVVQHEAGKKHRKPLDAVRDYYPAIIEEKDFRRVQSLRDRASPLRGRHATNGTVRNLFGGLLLCPKCGDSMTLVYKGAPPKGGTYVVCSKAKVGAGCTYRAIRYDRVEQAFLEDAKRLVNTVPAGDGYKEIDKELANVETVLEVIPDQIENVLDAIQKRGSAALSERLRVLEASQEEMRLQRDTLLERQAEAAGALVAHKVDDLETALAQKTLDRAGANTLLRQLLSSVTVDYENGRLALSWKHGGESEVVYAWPDRKKRAVRVTKLAHRPHTATKKPAPRKAKRRTAR